MLKRTFFRAFSDDDHDMMDNEEVTSSISASASQKPSEALKLLKHEYYLVNSSVESSSSLMGSSAFDETLSTSSSTLA